MALVSGGATIVRREADPSGDRIVAHTADLGIDGWVPDSPDAASRRHLAFRPMRYAEVPEMKCRERIEAYLRESNVAFEVQEHPLAFTAQEVAASEHVKGRAFAKVVIVVADGEMRMVVLPASEKVSFERLREVIRAKHARLASEDEFASRFIDCDPGAMPPFGHLYGLSVVIDDTLSKNDRIVFQLGTHTTTMSVKYEDFARIERPLVADLGVAPIPV